MRHRWTKEEKLDVFAMRIDGFTLQEIGDKYGVTREAIRSMLSATCGESGIVKRRYVYPNIAEWMMEKHMTQTELCKKIGIAQNTVSSIMRGRQNPNFSFVTAILQLTGMTFDEAFYKGDA